MTKTTDIFLPELVGVEVTVLSGTRKGQQFKIVKAWDRWYTAADGSVLGSEKRQYILDCPTGTKQFSNVKL